jgi:hypothetical protein
LDGIEDQVPNKIDCQLIDIYKQLRPPLIKQQTYENLSISIVYQILLFLAEEHVRIKIIFFFKKFIYLTIA